MQEPTQIPGKEEFAAMLRGVGLSGEVIDVQPLAGGFSSAVLAIDVLDTGGRRRGFVARRHGVSALEKNPYLARQEYDLLKVLYPEGLPVPEPVGLSRPSQAGEAAWLFVDRLENNPHACPGDPLVIAEAFAHLLETVHAIDLEAAGLGFLPMHVEIVDRILAHAPVSDGEREIRARLAPHWPPVVTRRGDVVLHGDLWAGNVLWNEGRIAGVVDWEDAARGDPLADLANTRLETLWAYGAEAMNCLTVTYYDRTGREGGTLPVWDLAAALVLERARAREDWGHSSGETARMSEQLKTFVEDARLALG